jgi:hypothetical protein
LNPRNPQNILNSIQVLDDQPALNEEYPADENVEEPGQIVVARQLNMARGRSNIPTERHYLGRMEVQCEYCHAFLWLEEKLCRSSVRNPKFILCCNQGDYTVEPLRPTLPLIRDLLTGNTSESREFKSKLEFTTQNLILLHLVFKEGALIHSEFMGLFTTKLGLFFLGMLMTH